VLPGLPAALTPKQECHGEVAMGSKKSLSEVERVLDDHASLSHLHALVKAGCDCKDLVSAMELAFLADEAWETLVGMELRSFKRELAHIRNCAGVIDRLSRSELIYRLSIEHSDPGFVRLHESPTLSERLREYVSLLDYGRKLFGPKRKISAHAWKALIVAHVIEDTKRPHDLEVSSLIAAVLDDPKYSEKAHQAWRLKYSDTIEKMVGTLRKHRDERRKILPPPPR